MPQKHQQSIRPSVVENIVKMLSCGLSIRGYATYSCPNEDCPHMKFVPFTCKARFCSTCGKKATANWIHKQLSILPQTEWQHITLTMPKQLWALFEKNRWLLDKLSSIAAGTIQTTAQQNNVTPGIFTALHTFGRDLKWNPHVHMSVTRGGLNTKQESWKKLFFRKETIMRMWRYRVIKLIRCAYKEKQL